MQRTQRAWLQGFIGMLMFSGTLPATRLAVATLDPAFLTFARAAIAGLLGLAVFAVRPAWFPNRQELVRLAILSAGCVVGFPLLTAEALREMTAADALVFVGLLPCLTAVMARILGDRAARAPFWIFAVLGAAIVCAYALHGGARLENGRGALLMTGAVTVCALGYAEGAQAARRLGGWQTIIWALLLALPVTLPLAILDQPEDWTNVDAHALAGLAYVSVFSMLVGFIFWFNGLAQGGTAAVGQLQLLQPFFGLIVAALLIGEPIGWAPVVMLAGVGTCTACARRFA